MYYLKEDVLMRKCRSPGSPATNGLSVLHQVVVPPSFRQHVLHLGHEVPMAGHMEIRENPGPDHGSFGQSYTKMWLSSVELVTWVNHSPLSNRHTDSKYLHLKSLFSRVLVDWFPEAIPLERITA